MSKKDIYKINLIDYINNKLNSIDINNDIRDMIIDSISFNIHSYFNFYYIIDYIKKKYDVKISKIDFDNVDFIIDCKYLEYKNFDNKFYASFKFKEKSNIKAENVVNDFKNILYFMIDNIIYTFVINQNNTLPGFSINPLFLLKFTYDNMDIGYISIADYVKRAKMVYKIDDNCSSINYNKYDLNEIVYKLMVQVDIEHLDNLKAIYDVEILKLLKNHIYENKNSEQIKNNLDNYIKHVNMDYFNIEDVVNIGFTVRDFKIQANNIEFECYLDITYKNKYTVHFNGIFNNLKDIIEKWILDVIADII